MKQIIIGLGIMAIAITACTKKRTSIDGYWTATLTAPASEGGASTSSAFLINTNGTMVYYSLKPNGDTSTANWRGAGTWTKSGTNVTMAFLDAASNHSYAINSTTNAMFTTLNGTFKIDVVDDAYTFAATVN
jgi:hypothetical protein